MKKPIIYVAHPSGGLDENKKKVETWLMRLYRAYPEYAFFSPIHNFGFAYNRLNYREGINLCLDFLAHADELWVCDDWRDSLGCGLEIEFAHENGIPVVFMGEGFMVKE